MAGGRVRVFDFGIRSETENIYIDCAGLHTLVGLLIIKVLICVSLFGN